MIYAFIASSFIYIISNNIRDIFPKFSYHTWIILHGVCLYYTSITLFIFGPTMVSYGFKKESKKHLGIPITKRKIENNYILSLPF